MLHRVLGQMIKYCLAQALSPVNRTHIHSFDLAIIVVEKLETTAGGRLSIKSRDKKRDVLAQKLIYRVCMATLWRVRKQPNGFIQLAQEFQRVGRIRSLFSDFWHGSSSKSRKIVALMAVQD